MERAKGFEPSTLTLARLCSTPELHPHSIADLRCFAPGGDWQRVDGRLYAQLKTGLQPLNQRSLRVSSKGQKRLSARVVRRKNRDIGGAAPPGGRNK